MSKAPWGEQTCGPQHKAKPAASLMLLKEEPSPAHQGEGHGRGEEPENAASRNLPAYGARNVRTVAVGTGEALPGPVPCGVVPERGVL